MSTRSLPIEHIVITDGFRDGEPHIAGKVVTVREIAREYTQLGASAESIADARGLTLAQVHAALAYYFDHAAGFDALIARDPQTPLPENLQRDMTVTEVSYRYGITPQAVRIAAKTGAIPARKSGATWLIKRRDAEARWGKNHHSGD